MTERNPLPTRSGAACLVSTAFWLGLAGCASQQLTPAGGLSPPDASTTQTAQQTAPGATGYTLTDADRDLDCETIRGRMRITLLQLRARSPATESTGLSRGLQSTVTSIFGGTSYGSDPNAFAKRETARLFAYNRLLKEQDCKTLDLEKELRPRSN